ncbi:MAG: hypothetical protein ACRERV_14520 [Methylococcales bacterium]
MKRISLLTILALVACAINTPDTTAGKPKDNGSIGGMIQYPGQAIPPMRICAFNAETQKAACVKIKAGEPKYRIANLPAAEYQIIAKVEQAKMKVGGHMLQVQCIRAPCPALLKSVSLQTGQALAEVPLNGFYESRNDFPVLPKGR